MLITRISKWLVSRKMLKCYLAGLLTLATLAVLFYVVENFRGARAWKRTVEKLAAEDISLNLADQLHPSIPNDDNFGAIPLLQDLTVVIDGDTEKGMPGAKRRTLKEVRISKQHQGAPKFPGGGDNPLITGRPKDLAKFRAYFDEIGLFQMPDTGNPAADILEGMTAYDSIFSELAAALDRPHAVFVPGLGERLTSTESLSSLSTPHYSVIQQLLATLKLRAIAAAQSGDPETAVESLRIMARLIEAVAKETRLIGWLVQATAVAVMEAGVWELLNSQTATNDQLTALEKDLERIDPRESFLASLKIEMIMATDYLELAKMTSQVELANLPRNVEIPEPIGPKLFPDGWWDQNKVSYCNRLRQVYLLAKRGDFAKTLNAKWIVPSSNSPYLVMMTLPALELGSQVVRLHIQNNSLVQMQAACALERHRLKHGEYPESLEPLLSIPLDPIDNQPMRYRRTADGRFILYSIGYDQTDNGGTIHPKGRKMPSSGIRAGKNSDVTGYDWVWRYSAE